MIILCNIILFRVASSLGRDFSWQKQLCNCSGNFACGGSIGDLHLNECYPLIKIGLQFQKGYNSRIASWKYLIRLTDSDLNMRFQHNAIRGIVLVCSLQLLLGCLPKAPSPGDASSEFKYNDLLTDESGHLVSEFWEAHFVREAKIGHRRTRVFQTDHQGTVRRRRETSDFLEMKRFGDVARQHLDCVSLEDSQGRVLQMAYQVQSGEDRSAASGYRGEGYVDGDVLNFETRRGGKIQEERFRWTKDNGGLFAVERNLLHSPMIPGEKRTVEAFLPLLDRVVQLQLIAVDSEVVEIEGEPKSLLRVVSTDNLTNEWGIPTIYWVDGEGGILKTHEGFLNRVTIRTTETVAMRPNDLSQLDVGLDVGVPLPQSFEQPHQTSHAVFRVTVDGLDPTDVFATGLSQQVSDAEDGSALVTVSRVTPDSPTVVTEDVQPPTPADTASNRLIQSDDRRVVAIAEAVAGSIQDPWQAAVALEQYLYLGISKTDFSQIFTSAAEVAEARRGDCSEHAVLLAATCRARGIPARVVVGLLYSPRDERFLYHMWNEVWIKDRWIPLDATLGNRGIGAGHLKLLDSSLADESPYSLVSPVVFLIDRMQVELIDSSGA